MIPGQLGPTSRVLFWVLRMSTTRTMSFWGIPSVMQTTSPISAAMASSMAAAATGGGTKIALRVWFISYSVPKTSPSTLFHIEKRVASSVW